MNNKHALAAYIIFAESLGLGATLGATPFLVGQIITVYFASQFATAPFAGKLSDKYGRRTILIVSQTFAFAGFIIQIRGSCYT